MQRPFVCLDSSSCSDSIGLQNRRLSAAFGFALLCARSEQLPFCRYAAGATIQIILFGLLAIEIKRKAPTTHTVSALAAGWLTLTADTESSSATLALPQISISRIHLHMHSLYFGHVVHCVFALAQVGQRP